MRNIVSLVFLIACLPVYGQNMLPLVQDTTGKYKGSFTLTSNGDYASNAIGKNIVQSFFYGGFIDQDMKNSSVERLQNINQFGLDMNAELSFRSKGDLTKKESSPFYNHGYIVQAGYHHFSSVVFSRDLFRYAFEGNSLFLGDTADFSGTRFQSMGYSKIGFGIFNRSTNNALTLNLISLNQFASGNMETASILQDSQNDTIQMDYTGEFSFAKRSGFSKGFGVSFDVDYRIQTNENDHKMTFQLLAKNIGFILPTNMTRYSADSSLQYTGFNLNQLVQQNILSTVNLADTLGIEKGTAKRALLLPGFIQFSKLVDMQATQRIQSFYGARMFLSQNYIPYFFAGIHGRVTKSWSTGLSASFGGFSQLKWGMYSSFQLSRWNIGVASENLFSKTGESIILQVKCAF
ncbi:MAG: hypothetical protein KA736_01695 [Crocinitomicaceae bacterium]|nr:hypothetical protein [Crocinitomicaceae bacterium]MBP6032638.1 hypothetical protein [Crocinitomicaceae bacterium]